MTSEQATGGGDIGRKDALPPDTLLNDYRLERVLGSGGFGIVYLARHEELARQVAIKEYLPAECAVREGLSVEAKGNEYRGAFEEGLTRFRDEARRLVELEDHPAIVSCRDFFRANGTAYLVMEYIEGKPLSTVLSTRETEGQPFDQEAMLNVIVPLLEGLAQAHEAGIIHRDIKPGNIMIRNHDGHPVLIDFGAAKQGVAELTKSMAPFTEGYAAIEQVGEGRLGPWTDIYAIGAVMWRMVAGGSPPWDPPAPVRVESRARAQLGGAKDPLPSARDLGRGRFSAGVLSVIEACLRLQESERTQDCNELLRILRTDPSAAGVPPRSIDAPTPRKPGAPRARRRLGLLAAALGTVLLVGAALSVVPFTKEPIGDRTLESEPPTEPSAPSVASDPLSKDRPPEGEALLGSFNVLAEPPDSKIEFLDGAGPYIPGMSLASGKYRVQVSAPGHRSSQIAIDHGDGPTVLRVELDAEVAASGDLGPVPSDFAGSGESDASAQFSLGEKHYFGRGTSQDYAEAVTWYRKAADQGHLEAQWKLGDMYYNGEGVSRDDEEAAAWYRKAADQGHATAQFQLAFCYRLGIGVPKDIDESLAWYRKAADQGHLEAQWRLAIVYDLGLNVPEDDREAATWYRKAADQGHSDSQWELGRMYSNGEGVLHDYGEAESWYRRSIEDTAFRWRTSELASMYYNGDGVPQDYEEAAALYRRAADQGDESSQFYLGLMYSKGQGVLQDFEEAAAWYRKAADQGDASAQVNLGNLYSDGNGVSQDYGKAVELYQKSADQGNSSAQFNLGLRYYNGEGVPKDYREAFGWYMEAADQGDASAQVNIGFMYSNGEGVPQDYEKAAAWYRKAAVQGSSIAQFNLGNLYSVGKGVPQDYIRAYAWWNIASAQGHEDARNNRDRFGGRMTREQIAEAQMLSRELIPK